MAQPDDPGWAASVTNRYGHYVSKNAIRAEHYGRPAGYGLCGVHGFLDEKGLDDGAQLPHCRDCEDRLAARGV